MKMIKISVVSILVFLSVNLEAQLDNLQLNISYNQEIVKIVDAYWKDLENYYGIFKNRKGIIASVSNTSRTKFSWLDYYYGIGIKVDGFVGRHVTLIEPVDMIAFSGDPSPQFYTDVDHWTRIKPELTFGALLNLKDFSLGIGSAVNYAVAAKVKRENWLYKSIIFKNEFLGTESVDPPLQITPWDIDLFIQVQKAITEKLLLNLSFRKGMLSDKDFDAGFLTKTFSFQVGLSYILDNTK